MDRTVHPAAGYEGASRNLEQCFGWVLQVGRILQVSACVDGGDTVVVVVAVLGLGRHTGFVRQQVKTASVVVAAMVLCSIAPLCVLHCLPGWCVCRSASVKGLLGLVRTICMRVSFNECNMPYVLFPTCWWRFPHGTWTGKCFHAGHEAVRRTVAEH